MQYFIFLLFLMVYNVGWSYTITINTVDRNSYSNIGLNALEDFQSLLQSACYCEVTMNNNLADISFNLPNVLQIDDLYYMSNEKTYNYPVYDYPTHDFKWIQRENGNQVIFDLVVENEIGLANALYGFLQGQLGFSFYHPRVTIIPDLTTWPNLNFVEWTAQPKFTIKGFHLHTQHPLELTEALHNPYFPDGEKMIKEYIDWLARNGQNYFEFNLLESVDLEEWIPYMNGLVDYMHSRGIIAGVDLSLHMIQQKSYMLYKSIPASFRSKKKQISKNVELLSKVGFDVWNMEFATAEFVQGNLEKKTDLRIFLIDLLREKDIRLMGREHVVKLEESVGGEHEMVQLTEQEYDIDKYRGVLIHTVMFYTIFEDNAPVYQNDNLKHMLSLMEEEQTKRETWYYPESAYWITFDNSIPMLLLPYLSARLADIDLMHEMEIPGHVTFSSGWEWGYWLIDWSIAQWSWKHSIDGVPTPQHPTQYLNNLNMDDDVIAFLEKSLSNQELYLKKQNLMKYLTAQTATDELPGPLNLEFHPRPPWAYKWLRNDAPRDSIDRVLNHVIPLLNTFAIEERKIHQKLTIDFSELNNIEQELIDAVTMVGLRAAHRAATLEQICKIRINQLEGDGTWSEDEMKPASDIRLSALEIVRRREQNYRYDLKLLSGEYRSHTAYDFGYLFPTHNLHFWNREEQQIIHNKWSARFMNIWDLLRIIGLKN